MATTAPNSNPTVLDLQMKAIRMRFSVTELMQVVPFLKGIYNE